MLSVECWVLNYFILHSNILHRIADHSTFHTPHSTFFYLQLCTPSVASSAVSTLTINWSTVFRVSFFFVSLMIVTVFLRVIHTCLFVLSFRFIPSAQPLEVIVLFLRQSFGIPSGLVRDARLSRFFWQCKVTTFANVVSTFLYVACDCVRLRVLSFEFLIFWVCWVLN